MTTPKSLVILKLTLHKKLFHKMATDATTSGVLQPFEDNETR